MGLGIAQNTLTGLFNSIHPYSLLFILTHLFLIILNHSNRSYSFLSSLSGRLNGLNGLNCLNGLNGLVLGRVDRLRRWKGTRIMCTPFSVAVTGRDRETR